MKEMTNWRVSDQIRMISLYDQQAGEVPWDGKLIPETGWCVTERAVVDLQRERGRWAREGYDIWRTSATMDWTEIRLYRYEGWVVVRTSYVRERILSSMHCVILSQCKDLRADLIWEDFGALTTARAREFWMCWRRFSWVVCCSKVSCSSQAWSARWRWQWYWLFCGRDIVACSDVDGCVSSRI